MDPYSVLELKENYEDLNEFYSEENDRKIEKNYIALKNFYQKKINEYMEKYQLSDQDIIGENYQEKVERAEMVFGKVDKENNYKYFMDCVDEIEMAEKEVQDSKKKLQDIEEAYQRIKSPDRRIIEHVRRIKSKENNAISIDSIKIESDNNSIEDKSEFESRENIKKKFFKRKKYLKGLTKSEIEELKKYLNLYSNRKANMETIELEGMPDGVRVYIKSADSDIEYSVNPGIMNDSFGVYDLTIELENGKKITKKVFTEKSAVLRELLKNPMYSKKLTKTVFSLENIMYALKENSGFLGIPYTRQKNYKQKKIADTYIGCEWDPYMYEAVKAYINQKGYEEQETGEQAPKIPKAQEELNER